MDFKVKAKSFFSFIWSKRWKVVHYIIVIGFLVQMFYAQYQIFFVLRPENGSIGPLAGQAQDVPAELIYKRRLYALEFWIPAIGLAIYLAILYGKKIVAKSVDAKGNIVEKAKERLIEDSEASVEE